jgi:hypothetical protein
MKGHISQGVILGNILKLTIYGNLRQEVLVLTQMEGGDGIITNMRHDPIKACLYIQ